MINTVKVYTAEEAEVVMNERGYKKTANSNGSLGEAYFFLKPVDKKISLHAFVNITNQQVQLDFCGMLDMGIKMMTEEFYIGTNVFENFENALLKYLRICLDQNGEEITLKTGVEQPGVVDKVVVATPVPVKKDAKERAKDFWLAIRAVGKEKGYEKEFCLEFYEYWISMNAGGKKMRYEMEKVFDLPRRLNTWLKNDQKWNSRYTKIQADKATIQNEQITKVVTLDPSKLF